MDEDQLSSNNGSNYQEEFDDEGRRLTQILSDSAGFIAPVQDDYYDDLSAQSQEIPLENLDLEYNDSFNNAPFFPEPLDNEINNNEFDLVDKVLPQAPKNAEKTKQKDNKGKPFKVLTATRTLSSSVLDPEEEKLKLLEDCCDFTFRRNEAYETDYDRNDMKSAWLNQIKLTPEKLKQLCFSESLLMVEENGTVVGKYYCTMTNSKWNDKSCLCVHAGSFGKFSTGLESGTSITSFISYNLHPIQEMVHEWATLNSNTIERKTFIMNEISSLTGKISLTRNGQIVDTKQFKLGFKERENLITEGGNLLLLRLLILEKRTTGSMTLQTISYTGKVVRAKYEELGSGWENVKGKQMKTWGIRRTVFVSDQEVRVWDSLYNKNARLVLRCQPDSPQALIPLWFETIMEFDKKGNFTGLYSPYAWACDVELYSKYAVKKEEITLAYRRYLLDHPEVRAMLSDYLQSILFKKPQNAVEFTQHYFEDFLNLNNPRTRRRSKWSSKKVGETDSNTTSSSYYGSNVSDDAMVEGEWLDEDDDDPGNFYPVNPTVSYEGLEQVDDLAFQNSENEMPTTTENGSEDDLVVNDEGEYIRRSI